MDREKFSPIEREKYSIMDREKFRPIEREKHSIMDREKFRPIKREKYISCQDVEKLQRRYSKIFCINQT